jgi:hypothetical protein
VGGVNHLPFGEKEQREQLLSGFYRWQEASGSKSIKKYSQESGCSYEYLKRCIKWKKQRERLDALKAPSSDMKLIKVAGGCFNESSGLVRLSVGKLSIEVTRESSSENLTKILCTLESLGVL